MLSRTDCQRNFWARQDGWHVTPRTLPHLSHWGAFSVTVDDDRITGVSRPSGRRRPVAAARQLPRRRSSGPARVARPAVRRGWLEHGPGPDERRGDDDFVEVELGRGARPRGRRAAHGCAAEHGNESIFGGSYGWASAGRFHHAQSQLHRFLNCIGGYTCVGQQLLARRVRGDPAPRRRRRATRCCAGRRRGRRSSSTPSSSSPSAA